MLLHEGVSRKRVFIYNLFSALMAIAGALIVVLVGEEIEVVLPYALSLTAGFFLYISLTNLLPAIHHEEKKGYAFFETVFLFLGVFAIWAVVIFLPRGY